MSSKITWYGHGALGLETGGYKLLVDPFLSDNPVSSASPEQVQADYILLSHGHSDHVGDTVEIAKHTGATVISNAEISKWLNKQGIKTHAQHLGGGYRHPFGYLKLTMALHGSGLPDGTWRVRATAEGPGGEGWSEAEATVPAGGEVTLLLETRRR